MEKEHKAFVDEKRSIAKKRERIIETLSKEKDSLQDRLDAIQEGPHARQDAKVGNTNFSISIWLKNCCLFIGDVGYFLYSRRERTHAMQIDKQIEEMLERKQSINKSMDEQKTSMWELEGHIKKVSGCYLLRIQTSR